MQQAVPRFRVSARALAGATVIAVFFTVGAADAQKKQYSYEESPMRLGMQALGQGRLTDARTLFEEAIANDHELARSNFGLAETLVHQGHLAQAEAHYRKAQELAHAAGGDLEFPEAHAGLGLLLLRLGRVDEARAQIHKAYQEKDDLWEANYAMALLAVEARDTKNARTYLDKGKGKKGIAEGEDRYHYGLARLYLAEGNVEAAEQEALLATTLNPANTDYAQLTGDIYVQRGSPGLAIQAYERAASAPGATLTAPFFHQLGGLFEKINEPNEALRRYQESVKIDSTYAPALRDLGKLYARGRVHDKAFVAYSRFVQLVPDDLDALIALTRAGLEARQFKNAHASAKRAFAMDSTKVETRLLYARAAAQDKDPATAERLYASLPDSVQLEAVDHVRLGQIAFEAQRFDDAKTHLDQSVAMDSTSVEAYFILGLTELRRNQPDPAIAALQRATVIAPAFTPAALNLGIAYLQAKRTDEGIAALRAAHTAAPENTQVLLSLAQALATADSTAAAVAEYRRVIEIDESNAKAYRGLGLCQLQRKSYGEAVTSLKQATSLEGGNADGWAMLGQAYLGLNDVPRAKQAAERALSINSGHATARSVLDVVKQARR